MKVAVIGTGTLGPAIAQVFAQSEIADIVYLCKGRDSSKRNGLNSIKQNCARLVERKKMTEEHYNAICRKIETGTLELARDADMLVEAVAEDLAVKKSVFSKLDSICRPECYFATNTSSLPIKSIGDNLSRPLIGFHFFNPAPVMQLVEVITTDLTPQIMTEFFVQTAVKIGKTPIVVNEAPGFVVNRVLIPMINEAVSIYAEGVASVESIDTAMVLGANFPMGPLALGDLIGLDVVLAILNVMLKETGNPKYVPQPMLKRMVRENRLGRKTGEGFYKYNQEEHK